MKLYDEIKKHLSALIAIPSPVSYYERITPYMYELGKNFNLEVSQDEKNTIYFKMEGLNHDKSVCVGGHLDTLGFMVRSINSDGTLKLRPLGGLNYCSLEDAYVHVVTRDEKEYDATIHCISHSVHVYDNARTLTRDENTLIALLDEDVKSKEDVLALGINNGDIVYCEPKYRELANGYIKSRYIDDKASCAAILATIEYMVNNKIKPYYDTYFAFPIYEEIGHGGAYVPSEIKEYLAVDIGLIGEEYDGDEHKVSICAKDNYTPYDRNLTTTLINLAKANNIDYVVDVYYRYGSDASAAIRAGNNIKAACIGMGCMASHGVERTHIDGINETCKLIYAYLCQRSN